MQAKSKNHFFKYLETFDNKEKIDFDKLIEQKDLSIEHIMPQTLSPKWKDELGDNYEDIHTKYLHTIGNLTLTGYNSKYSNSSFSEKKIMEKGFNESTLFVNSFLKTMSTWNEKTILQRADLLTNRALKIWSYPCCNYTSNIVITENCYSLSDDLNLTGEKIYQFDILGTRFKVDAWKDFLDKILLAFYDLDSNLLRNLANNDFSNRLSTNSKNHTNPMKIAENLFVESNLSTSSITSLVYRIAKKYQLNDDDVTIYIR